MSLHVSKPSESVIAEATFVRLFSCMNQFMLVLVSKSIESFIAVATFVRFFSCMSQFVFLFCVRAHGMIFSFAVATFVRFFSCMNFYSVHAGSCVQVN